LKNTLFAVQAFDRDAVLARGREVVQIEREALTLLERSLDDRFVVACQAILETKRQLVVTGMGKSGHIGRKVAATFAATGTPAVFIHPAEASHGDLGMLVRGDVLLVFSNSGNTAELRSILTYARNMGVCIIGVAARAASLLMEQADIPICLPLTREACAANVAPTTSTALQLALGDAMAMAVMDMRGISKSRLRSLHPGGNIGLQLTPITEIMHGRERLPLVAEGAGMPDVISIMTSGRFGLSGVIDGLGNLVGVITDGDLRRHFDSLVTATASEVMTRSPKTLPGDMLAADALMFLNDNKITAAFVIDRFDAAYPMRPVGIVHIHDLLRLGLN
jgi:arabinose-5-phosphate isomerase